MTQNYTIAILRQIRVSRGESQKQAAEFFGLTKDSGRQIFGQWERGEVKPGDHHRARFIEYVASSNTVGRSIDAFESIWQSLCDRWNWGPLTEGEWQSVSTFFLSVSPLQNPAWSQFGRLPTKADEPIPEPSLLPIPHHMPFHRNRDFVGRAEEFRAIAAGISTSNGAVVAAGIGGVGKTQLVIEWVYRYAQYFQGGVFWLDFQTESTALLSIATAGEAYGWPNYTSLTFAERVSRVRRQWEESVPTLLILDNCDDPKLAQNYLPRGGAAHLLVTSRNLTWATAGRALGISQVDIAILPRSDSIDLLQALCPMLGWSYAENIAEILGDLPLALHIAGNYLNKYRETEFGNPTYYITQLKARLTTELEDNVKWWKEEFPTRHERSVRATFSLSLERLRAKPEGEARIAERIITRLAHLAPGVVVPKAWLSTGSSTTSDTRLVVDAVETLLSVGLVEESQPSGVRLHRLVADVILTMLEVSRIITQQEVALVLQTHQPEYGQPEYLTNLSGWITHLTYVLAHWSDPETLDTAQLYYSLADHYCNIAQYPSALDGYLKSLLIRNRILGGAHPLTADSLNDVGFVYKAMGEYVKAEEYYQQALQVRQQVQGPLHIDTAQSLNNLAGLASARGEYDRAKSLYKEALSIRQMLLGKTHPDSVQGLNNLAAIYKRQGDYKKAIAFCRETLLIYRLVLGLHHPTTALSLNNLGVMYETVGELVTALPLHRQALVIRRRMLGETHVDSGISMSNLGIIYAKLGNFERARTLCKAGFVIVSTALGLQHNTTAAVVRHLARAYEGLQDKSKAIELYHYALRIFDRIYTKDNAESAKTLLQLGMLHLNLNDGTTALSCFQESYRMYKQIFGNSHPDTVEALIAMNKCRVALELPPL